MRTAKSFEESRKKRAAGRSVEQIPEIWVAGIFLSSSDFLTRRPDHPFAKPASISHILSMLCDKSPHLAF